MGKIVQISAQVKILAKFDFSKYVSDITIGNNKKVGQLFRFKFSDLRLDGFYSIVQSFDHNRFERFCFESENFSILKKNQQRYHEVNVHRAK